MVLLRSKKMWKRPYKRIFIHIFAKLGGRFNSCVRPDPYGSGSGNSIITDPFRIRNPENMSMIVAHWTRLNSGRTLQTLLWFCWDKLWLINMGETDSGLLWIVTDWNRLWRIGTDRDGLNSCLIMFSLDCERILAAVSGPACSRRLLPRPAAAGGGSTLYTCNKRASCFFCFLSSLLLHPTPPTATTTVFGSYYLSSLFS